MFPRYCVLFFNKLKVCGDSAWSKSNGATFSNSVDSFRVFVSHFGNSSNISGFFIITVFVLVICDQWYLVLLLWPTEGSDDGKHF